MLNLTNMVRAPMYDFQVFMVRNKTLNDAKREARKQNPQFFPQSARRV